MGRMDKCESLLRKLTATTQQTVNRKSALRAVTIATKSRKMKTLRFQKRRCGTAPTVIGQHTERAEIDIFVLSCQHESLKIKMPILIIWQMKWFRRTSFI